MTKQEDLVEVPKKALESATKAIGDLFGAAEKANDKASNTAKEAREARDNSIRSLPEKLSNVLHGTNYSFDDVVVNPDVEDDSFGKDKVTIGELLAHRVAKKLAKGNTQRGSPYNSRKSELKLLIETRDHLGPMIDKLDAYVEKVTEQEGEPPNINIRQQALAGLRKIRKDTTGEVTPDAIVEKLDADRTYEPSAAEKAEKALDRLEKMDAFHDTVLVNGEEHVVRDDRADKAFEILREVIEQGADGEGTMARAAEKRSQQLEEEMSSIVGEDDEDDGSLNDALEGPHQEAPDTEAGDDEEEEESVSSILDDLENFENQEEDENDDQFDIDSIINGG